MEIESQNKQKAKYENSIRELNSKLENTTESIGQSNLDLQQEIGKLKAEKGSDGGKVNTIFKDQNEERKIVDLKKDLADIKKNLNGKMIELQKIQQEIKVGFKLQSKKMGQRLQLTRN